MDYGPTLTSVAKLAVPDIADWCAVDMVGPGSAVERLAVAHVNDAKIRSAMEIEKRYPTDPQSPNGVHEVIRSGRSILMPEIPDLLLVQAAINDEHLRLIPSSWPRRIANTGPLIWPSPRSSQASQLRRWTTLGEK